MSHVTRRQVCAACKKAVWGAAFFVCGVKACRCGCKGVAGEHTFTGNAPSLACPCSAPVLLDGKPRGCSCSERYQRRLRLK